MQVMRRAPLVLAGTIALLGTLLGCGSTTKGNGTPTGTAFGSTPATLPRSTAMSTLALRDPSGYTATFTITRSAVVKDSGSAQVGAYTLKDPQTCNHSLSASTPTIGLEPFVATITNTTEGFPISVGVNLATTPVPAKFNFSVEYVGPGYAQGECDPLTDSQGAAFNAESLAPGTSENFYGVIALFGYYAPNAPEGLKADLSNARLEIYANNDLPGGQNFGVVSAVQATPVAGGRDAAALIPPG